MRALSWWVHGALTGPGDSASPPNAPRALAAAIDAGLAPDPAARPPLHALLDVLDEHAGRPAGPGRWSR